MPHSPQISMPRKPSFSYLKTPYGWKVEIPTTLSASGNRERAFFKTRDKARDYAEELSAKHKEHGANHLAIKPSLAEAAIRAEAILAPTGASLIEAANAYRKIWDAKNSSCLLKGAIKDYLASRADLRDSTLKSYKYSLDKVLAPLHDLMMAEIQSTDLEKILNGKGATARAMHLRNIRTFWKWAVSPTRAWATMATVDALEASRISSDADIKILKPDDVKALLEAAELEGPASAAAYAIAVFGGVRMAELEKLAWGDVGEDHIEIGRTIAKKHSRRLIPVCATLKAWLDAARGDNEDDTSIVPPNWSDVSKSVRRRAGWNVAARLLNDKVESGKLKKLPKITRGKWPANGCRHTCASVQVAIGTPLDDLTFKFGHSGGHDLLRRHYVSRMTKKDAIAILSIGPGGKEVSNLLVA
jgi:integrase